MHNPDLGCHLPNYLQIFCSFDLTEFLKSGAVLSSPFYNLAPVKNCASAVYPETQIKFIQRHKVTGDKNTKPIFLLLTPVQVITRLL